MALMRILTVPDPLLRRKCAPVGKIDGDLRKTLDDMLETMYAAPGVGLAAPQVGILKRMVVIDVTRDGEERHPYRMIDPVITAASDTIVLHDEGCLSVPEQYAEVERFESVTVEYTDENGERQTLTADGLLAICIQHELEHLDGHLFIDHLSKVKRDMIVRRVEKEQRRKRDAAKHGEADE